MQCICLSMTGRGDTKRHGSMATMDNLIKIILIKKLEIVISAVPCCVHLYQDTYQKKKV